MYYVIFGVGKSYYLSYHALLPYFFQYKTFKLVYRRYAGLYFVFCVDVTDNELLYLETIHLFVEVSLIRSRN